MRILAIDVGTGTQDILLFDSDTNIENCPKAVMPSPTAIVAQAIRSATSRGDEVLLTGVTMGGGPCNAAARDHIGAGHRVFATCDAARTFNDDLEVIKQMGVHMVSEDEAARLTVPVHLELKDFDWRAIETAFSAFGVDMRLDAIAVGVFDHGNAPPDVSDRWFRFEYLKRTLLAANGLCSFAHWRDEVPEIMTRMLAVANTVDRSVPLLVMDNASAAVLGALGDPTVAQHKVHVAVNVGNAHSLAFYLDGSRVKALFEHHTRALDAGKLEGMLGALVGGTITNEWVFNDGGHGALVLEGDAAPPGIYSVTGPRRGMMEGSPLRPHFPSPHGDMMLAGCFGMLRAAAAKRPEWHDAIIRRLDNNI